MYISGAKFEEHCSNISGDILEIFLIRFKIFQKQQQQQQQPLFTPFSTMSVTF